MEMESHRVYVLQIGHIGRILDGVQWGNAVCNHGRVFELNLNDSLNLRTPLKALPS